MGAIGSCLADVRHTQFPSNQLSKLRFIVKFNDSPQGDADSFAIAHLRRLEYGIDRNISSAIARQEHLGMAGRYRVFPVQHQLLKHLLPVPDPRELDLNVLVWLQP